MCGGKTSERDHMQTQWEGSGGKRGTGDLGAEAQWPTRGRETTQVNLVYRRPWDKKPRQDHVGQRSGVSLQRTDVGGGASGSHGATWRGTGRHHLCNVQQDGLLPTGQHLGLLD